MTAQHNRISWEAVCLELYERPVRISCTIVQQRSGGENGIGALTLFSHWRNSALHTMCEPSSPTYWMQHLGTSIFVGGTVVRVGRSVHPIGPSRARNKVCHVVGRITWFEVTVNTPKATQPSSRMRCFDANRYLEVSKCAA